MSLPPLGRTTNESNSNHPGVGAETVLQVLTRRQYLHPHAPLREALSATIDELHCCPAAVQRAMQWLQLDFEQPIGRLRRTELTQLARVIHRFWNQPEAQKRPASASSQS